MKILKTSEPFKRVIHCKDCDTVFEVDLDDVHVRTYQINGSDWDQFYVECPVCPQERWSFKFVIDDEFDQCNLDGEHVLDPQEKFLVRTRG